MKKLIEFKLHAGRFPYFVDSVIGGVEVGGKRYGVSKDTATSYLPDTVVMLTEDEFIERVKAAVVMKGDSEGEVEPMTDEEKEAFAREWLGELGLE